MKDPKEYVTDEAVRAAKIEMRVAQRGSGRLNTQYAPEAVRAAAPFIVDAVIADVCAFLREQAMEKPIEFPARAVERWAKERP